MPRVSYLNTPTIKIQRATRSLCAISRLFSGECGTAKEFSKVVKVTPPTAKDRLDRPDRLTLAELITASVNLGMSGEVILQNGETRVAVKW